MWTALRPCLSLAPKPTNTKPPLEVIVSASSGRQQPRASPVREHKQKKQDEEVQPRQLKGLDVLRAMQRAAAEKKSKFSGGGSGGRNRRRRGVSSAGSNREEDDVDYSNVRPLCIKDEWGVRLDDLEKRLQELSQTK